MPIQPPANHPNGRAPSSHKRDDAIADADAARPELRAMDVRTAPRQDTIERDCEDDTGAGAISRCALIHLCACSAPVAIALAAVIVKGAGR